MVKAEARRSEAPTPAQLQKRRDAAKPEFDRAEAMRAETYQYAIPYRKSTKDSGTGEKRVNQAFDHTAFDAAFRFAGRLQQDLWPAEETNFALEPGPLVTTVEERDQLKRQLEPITLTCVAYFEDPDWGTAFHEMALDLAAGTGAILMNKTDEPGKLWEPISAPIDELMVEAGVNGKPSGIFWDRKQTARVLEESYPDGTFGEDLRKLIAENPESEITVHYDVVRKRSKSGAYRWYTVVWCDKQKDQSVHETVSRTSPWLLPRYFRIPGEVYGRGLVSIAMPTIKTLNTAARLQLQAAAIAMLGIYTAVDDGVFNPDLSPVQPGAFWKVQRNGGTMGRSVERFPDPRLDLTQLVLTDLRQGVRATMMDDDLPASDEAVKSPTEILERIKKAASNHMGAFERLVKEITIPAVKRVLELAYDAGLVKGELNIDQLLIKLKINSPLAVARAAARVQRNLEWVQMVAMVETMKLQAPIDRLANSDAILLDAASRLGIPTAFITSTDARKQIDERVAAERQAMALAAAAKGGAAA